MDAFSLQGRTALVTGASRGIGAAIARALDRAGARVALAARDRTALDAVARELHNDPVALESDLADPDAPRRLAQAARTQLGSVDVLVNNAGIGARLPIEDLDGTLIDRLYAVNVRAPLLLVSALIPAMRERGRGAIVNVSSVSGILGIADVVLFLACDAARFVTGETLSADGGMAKTLDLYSGDI